MAVETGEMAEGKGAEARVVWTRCIQGKLQSHEMLFLHLRLLEKRCSGPEEKDSVITKYPNRTIYE